MSKEIAIEVENLSKSFKLPTESSSELKQKVVNTFKGVKGYKEQRVLRDISFTIEKGDFVGIVGRNGSGKSTLLKILSGIYEPDRGKIHISGSLVPFIELGVGFNPELTGRENVYMNGALLGFSTEEVNSMYDEIIDFAEIHEFMDQKLKNYSSGMQVRLAFSIAIRAKSDILLLDEVLAVGDEAFQRKCFSYFARLKRENRTVVLVTHSMDQVQQFCNKAILIQDGRITKNGNPADVAQRYRELNASNSGDESAILNQDQLNIQANCQKNWDKVTFEANITSKVNIQDAVITFVINRDTGEIVYRFTTDENWEPTINIKSNTTVHFHIELENIFPVGLFDVQLAIKSRDRSQIYADFGHIVQFEIDKYPKNPNNVHWRPATVFSIRNEKSRSWTRT
jgi:ABC-2 type transport system ATP-binding protein